MIKDLIAAGGPSLIVPIAMSLLFFYLVRGLFGLHGRRSQHRREFLEHWDPKRVNDDLWLEVTIRHLYGTHLPAHVIRTALAHPHTSQALLDLSELWTLLRYDPEAQTIDWKYKRHRDAKRRVLLRYWPEARYFLFAGIGMAAAYHASRVDGWSQWVFALLALIMLICAFLSLWHGESEKAASASGETWIKCINAASVARQIQSKP